MTSEEIMAALAKAVTLVGEKQNTKAPSKWNVGKEHLVGDGEAVTALVNASLHFRDSGVKKDVIPTKDGVECDYMRCTGTAEVDGKPGEKFLAEFFLPKEALEEYVAEKQPTTLERLLIRVVVIGYQTITDTEAAASTDESIRSGAVRTKIVVHKNHDFYSIEGQAPNRKFIGSGVNLSLFKRAKAVNEVKPWPAKITIRKGGSGVVTM